jgi:hypothetical protein
MSLLDFLRPQGAQAPGSMSQPRQSGLSLLLGSPEARMAMAGQLMGNQGNAANFGNAMTAGALGIGKQRELQAQTAEQNKTMEFFKQNAPEYGAMIDAGMPVNEAWQLYRQQRFAKEKGQGLINAGDGNLYDPDSKSWITAPGGAQKAPQVVELFDEASGQPYKATWDQETQSYKRVGGVKARSGMQLTTNPDGTVSLTEGPLSNRPKLTEGEAKNAGFLERVNKSSQVLDALEGQGTSLYNKTIGNIPVVGNYARSQDAQKYDQAKRDFVNAVLRRESGAVISDQEFANAEQQYFPQPGDGPEVIAQKRANREAARKGLDIGSGQGAGMVTPQGPQRFRFNPETGELE